VSEWGISWLELASYFQEKRVEFTVRENPEEALEALKRFLEEGPFVEATKTDKMLEMKGPLVESVGFWGCLIIAILSFATAFAIWLAFFVAMLVFPKPSVIAETERKGSLTHLTITARAPRTFALTERWVRENLEVE
jgi:hypothetical protein